MDDGSIESHLINPHDIASWTDWEQQSQEIHGLSQHYLSEHGKEPKWVAMRMNEVLSDKVLLSDAYKFDLDWCETLFKASDEVMMFTIVDSWEVFGKQLNSDILLQESASYGDMSKEQRIYQQITTISDQAWQAIKGKQHRASVDVQQLIEMWKIMSTTKVGLIE